MTKVTIIGAGLAGLLAGNMLRHRSTIIEKQEQLPNNHHALLRFRTDVFATVVGIPFKKVKMIKAVYGANTNPIRNELQYAQKVTGVMRTDRSLPIGVVKEDRYIAPPDLINQLANMCNEIKYGIAAPPYWNKDLIGHICEDSDYGPVISTIPMPQLMEMLDYSKRDSITFDYFSGSVVSATVADCDAYATYYFPDHQHDAYRASITGNRLIIEMRHGIEDAAIANASYYAQAFGINPKDISDVQFKQMKYAKIMPIDEDIRKDFMHWATINFNIYSLGRYATWRPGLLLDDLVNDVSLISRWILKGGKYNAAKHWT